MSITTKAQVPTTTVPSSAPGTSLAYITIGGIMSVLAGTSYYFFDTTNSPLLGYLRMSVMILGIMSVVVGFTVGYIGRAARKAELPPRDTNNPVVRP